MKYLGNSLLTIAACSFLIMSYQVSAVSYHSNWKTALENEIRYKCNYANGSVVASQNNKDGSSTYKIACGVSYSVGMVDATNYKYITCRASGGEFVCG